MKYRLLTVVINYKTPSMTLNCVKSVLADMDCVQDQVVIVDNFSNDGSVEHIEGWIKNNEVGGSVALVSSGVNGGFSYGCNLGAESAESEWVMFINSDALVERGAISKLIDQLLSDDKIGAAAPQIVNLEGGEDACRFYNITPLTEFMGASGTGLVKKAFNLFNVYDVIQYENGDDTPEWVSFACVMLRENAYRGVGPLDEGYFMYYEDSDYCRRLILNDWKIAVSDDAKIVHLNEGLSSLGRRRMPGFFYASRTRYFKKHYGFGGLVLANSLFCFGMLVRWSRFLVGKGEAHGYTYVFIDVWKNIFRPLFMAHKKQS